ncbi:hypothetical protein TNCV_3311711 [Trichonephila clavipes]|nr:hypothetical protein TNCV_3311711 [Trichonephila clavipes]
MCDDVPKATSVGLGWRLLKTSGTNLVVFRTRQSGMKDGYRSHNQEKRNQKERKKKLTEQLERYQDGPRNFQPRSSDDIRAGTLLTPNYHTTQMGGHSASTDLKFIGPLYTAGFQWQQDLNQRHSDHQLMTYGVTYTPASREGDEGQPDCPL